MKDFVKEYGRIAGIVAGAGFVLSILVGLLSRNPFGVSLGRAVLLGVAFGALGAGLKYVFTKYLSEPVGDAQPGAASTEGRTGQTVDITLPEENPVSMNGLRKPPSPENLAEEADAQTVLEAPDGGQAAMAGLSEPEGSGLTDEFNDELPPLVEPGEEDSGPEDDEGEGFAESVEEAESVAEEPPEPPAGRSARAAVEAGADSGLDSLPDISSLGAPAREPQARMRGRREPEDTPNNALKGKLGGQDPATLARAIRTVLKRDEKG